MDGGRIVAGGKASTLVNTLASARSLASGNTTTSGSTAVSGITAVTGPPASAATINAVPTTSSHLLLMAKTQLEMARFLSGIWSAFGLNGKAPELYPSTIAAALTTQKSTASPSSTLIPPGTRAEAIFQRVAPAAVPELFLDPLAIASAVNVRGWTSEETRLHFWSLLREQQRLQQTAAAQLKVVVPGSAAGMDSPTKGAEGVVDTPTVNTRLVLQMCDVAVSTPKRKRTEVEVFVPALKKGPSSSKSESISSESTSDEEEDDDDDESLMEKHQGSPKRLAIASSIPAAMQTRSSQRRDSIASDSNSWMDVEDEESDKKPPPVPAKHTSIAGTRYRSIAPRPSSLGSTDNNDDCDSIDQSKIVKRQPAPIVPKLATGATNLASTVTNSKTVTGYKSYRRNHFIQAIRTAEQQALSEERRQLAEQKASLEDERRRLEQDRMEMASAVGFGQPAPSVVYSQYGYGGVPQAANNMPYGAYPQHVMMNPALGGMPPHLYYQQPGTIFPAPQILGYHGAPVAGNVSTGDYGPDPSDSVSAVMEREDHAVPMSVVGAMPMSVVGAMPMTMVGAMPAQQPEAEEPLTHGLVGMIAGEKRSRSTAYDPRLGTYRAKGEDAGPKHAGARPFVPPQQMTAYPPAPSMAAGGYGMFQPQMGGSVVGGNGGYAASAVGSTVYYAPQMMFGASMAPQQQRGSVVGMPYGYPPMMMAAQQQQPYVPPAPSSMAFANQQQFRQSGVFPVNTIPEGEEEE